MSPERIPYETFATQEGNKEAPVRPSDIIKDIESLIDSDDVEQAMQTGRYAYLLEFTDTNNYLEWAADVLQDEENWRPETVRMVEEVDERYGNNDRLQEKMSVRKKLIFTAEQISRDLERGVISDGPTGDKRCA